MRVLVLIAAVTAVLLLAIFLLPENAQRTVGPITTREMFEELVVDRPIAGGEGWIDLIVRSDRTFSGIRSDGLKVNGLWYFERGNFCREPIIEGKSLGWDCQIVSVDGNDITFIRKGGKGKKVKYSFK